MKRYPPSPPSFDTVLAELRDLARPDQLEGMKRFGLTGEGRLGVSIPALRKLAGSVGKNHRLAGLLWKTGIPDAMILSAFVGEPEKLTRRQMDHWVKDICSWDVCDQVCSNLFDRSPLAWEKIRLWSMADKEFVRRAGYVLIASLAVHDRSSPDRRFLELLPLIRRGATDDRNFVKKGVNWALRHIGKRNERLRVAAIGEARRIQRLPSRAARWIAADALRELNDPKTVERIRRRREPD
jgi:3-methyladenine DNA glycosylase AlkD